MKKTLALVLSALLLAGTTATTIAADAADEFALASVGTQIQGPMDFVSGSLADAMDGDPTTIADFGVEGGEEYWFGVQMDAPVILTRVEGHGPGYKEDGTVNRPHVLYGLWIEGSNDGENWTPILVLGDNYSEYEEYAWDMEDGINNWWDEDAFDGETEWDDDATEPVAYTYFRVYNDTRGVAIWGDFQFYGYYAEVEAPETEAPETAAPETAAPETAAPETAAPETAAPETAAPETTAPETTAPETAAPETAAPETTAPETTAPETAAPETDAPVVTPPTTDTPVAPQTFDAGIIAAVAAVVSAAGYAIARKRK